MREDEPELGEVQESAGLAQSLVRIVRQTRIPGISASVLKDGTIRSACAGTGLDSGAAGSAHLIRFDIGCITAGLISLVALQLVRAGELDLEAPIDFYLPDIPRNMRSAGILVWHLLSHSSGYVGIGAGDRNATIDLSWREFLQLLARSPQVFKPGTVFNYHIADHVILARILTRLKGVEPQELVRSKILEPIVFGGGPAPECLGEAFDPIGGHRWNRQSGTFEKQVSAQSGPLWAPVLSGLRLSTQEMLRLVVAIMGCCDDSCIGPTAAIDAVTGQLFQKQVVQIPAPARRAAGMRWLSSYGLGCGAYTDGSLGICGTASGQSCAVHFDCSARIAVAVAINASAVPMRNRIGTRLMASLRGTGSDPPTDAQARETFCTEEISGSYIGGVDGQEVRVSLENGTLALRYKNERNGRALERPFTLGENGEVLFGGTPGPLHELFPRARITGGMSHVRMAGV